MERIKYAIDYVKDKLIDQNDVLKMIDKESYETLLEEELKEILIKNHLLKFNLKKFDDGWYPMPFLIFRIFLLFEICTVLRQEGTSQMRLSKCSTFKQVYEKGMKELQVQLTTY
ncbi:hypothetical protein RFI_31785 [Reticulomyxa filosa]|uniref:Uncharacterized protein n=1 Tax=Reticulomyxa filosa TaxID=46433 RepID=X6LUK0_RETFI|nr:hypothetical protein RFI_31785 [Reticulomyxa filosa]|eukprot:ETO05613.1 hypothetical protein RFI_31785 [Reticulomyxa filosa]